MRVGWLPFSAEPCKETMAVTYKSNHAKVKKQMRRDVARGQNKAFEFFVKTAKGLAPIGKTRRLVRGIKQHLRATIDKPRAAAKSEAPYSAFVNSGTYKMAARPFWTVALLRMYQRFGGFFK